MNFFSFLISFAVNLKSKKKKTTSISWWQRQHSAILLFYFCPHKGTPGFISIPFPPFFFTLFIYTINKIIGNVYKNTLKTQWLIRAVALLCLIFSSGLASYCCIDWMDQFKSLHACTFVAAGWKKIDYLLPPHGSWPTSAHHSLTQSLLPEKEGSARLRPPTAWARENKEWAVSEDVQYNTNNCGVGPVLQFADVESWQWPRYRFLSDNSYIISLYLKIVFLV